MVGTGTNSNDAKSFSGTFDGNGHSLTVSYTSASDYATAPFRFLSNATVKNLHVDGTVTANHKYAAGLAGRTYGTTLIQGCRVSIVINSSFSGDGTNGGIVANNVGGSLTINASEDTYNNFEYKIPEGADGSMNTSKIVDGNKVTNATITIPAGIYDWCITNPSPNDCVWIAADYGNIGGRKDNFVFEAGKHYTFTVSGYGSNDCVDMTVDDDELNQGNTTTDDIITSTSYDLSGLTASTF